MGCPDPAEKEAEVIVDFGDGTDRRPRVVGNPFLLDRDGGRKAGNVIDIRLVEHPEKLAGISGKGLDIPSLSLGENRIEGQ